MTGSIHIGMGAPIHLPKPKRAKLTLPSYYWEPVFRDIADRFYRQHRIFLQDHIATLKRVSHLHGEGIDFIPVDHKKFIEALRASHFKLDNKRHLCDAVAASATNGVGYREVGIPSLHCQVSSGSVNVHIDAFGFVAMHNGQKIYTPDAIQHIIDELVWAKVVAWIRKRDPELASLLEKTHPVVPHSKIKYAPVAGGRIDIRKGKGWSLAYDYTVGFAGERKGERRHRVMLEIPF